MDSVPAAKRQTNLLDLDDYSLLNIMKYFRLYDLVSLRFVNTRFVPLFMKTLPDLPFERLFATAAFVAKYPPRTCEHVYKALAEACPNVHIHMIKEVDMVRILPCYTQIDELDINVDTLRNKKAIDTFPLCKKLFIGAENTKRPYMNALMKRLGPTLEVLDCCRSPNLEFILAPNLKELMIDHVWLGRKRSGQFWRGNRTLSELTLTGDPFINMLEIMNPTEMHSDFEIVEDNWKAIAKIPSLKSLDWRAIGGKNLRANVLPRFNNVTIAKLEFYGQPLVLPVLEAFGEQVKDLNVTAELTTHQISVAAIDMISRRFPNLERLFFSSNKMYTLSQLLPLVKLEKLTYLEVKIANDATYLALFKRIKSLELLRNNAIWKEKDLHVPKEFKAWAKTQERCVKVERRTYDHRDEFMKNQPFVFQSMDFF